MPFTGNNLPPVARHTAEGAVALGRYFLAHAQVCYSYAGVDPVTEGARRIMEWLRMTGAPTFVERACFNANRTFDDMSALRSCLNLLADFNYVRQGEAPPRTGPGRAKSPTWDVNPAVFEPEAPAPVADPEGVAS